ncbi:hypothetical protein AB0L85_03180 [Streptomyces sp. NPDC052051]|uniref:hypothetical protein n=1 Tax=Streptomyces sp. NPDC052051 TaxID=3154649 RepID=UPI003443F68B
MIDPGEIFQYTGDFDKLSTAVTALRTHAIGIRNKGQDVHSRFQATAAYYKAPEADQLFSSTQPVMDTADNFAGDIESLADALDTFIGEAKPYAKRLERLKEKAIAFVGSVEGDDDWTKDQDKVDAQKALMDGVAIAVAGFQEAERNAATKINAISPALCRPGWVVDDGSHALGMYGLSADTMKGLKDLPWGSAEGRTYERWSLDWWGHGVKSWAWDGFVKDGLWGSFIGLGDLEANLLGINGSAAQHETWDGIKRTAVGTYAYGMDAVGLGDHLSDWQRGSEAYTKEFGKQLIAYDMWNEDPARAHGLATFNLLTVVGGAAGGLAWLGRGGRIAEAAGTVAKVADVLDPISGTARAARALSDLPKISETLARVSEHLKLPKSKFPDGALDDLSNRYRVDKDGNFIALKPDGTPDTGPVRHEPAVADRATGSPSGDRELVGTGARTGEAGGHVGGHLTPREGYDTEGGAVHGSGGHASTHRDTHSAAGSGEPTSDGRATHPEHTPGVGEHAHDGNVNGTPPTSGGAGGRGNAWSSSPHEKGVWTARGDIPGPAAGEELKRPNARHTISGVAGREIKEKNSIILRGYSREIDKDIAGIAEGRAKLTAGGNRYEINGRTYGVEPGGRVYPESGPGIVNLDRNEYAALQQVVKAKGDINAAPQLTRNPRFVNNPQAVQKALDIYNGTYQ